MADFSGNDPNVTLTPGAVEFDASASYKIQDGTEFLISGTVLTAERLYTIGDPASDEKNATAVYMASCSEAFFQLKKVLLNIKDQSPFEADIAFMNAKQHVYALSKFRNFGEGVTLVIWSLAKLASRSPIATLALPHIEAMCSAIQDLKRAPNMDFQTAIDIVDKLEDVGGDLAVGAYDSVSSLLLGENYASE